MKIGFTNKYLFAEMLIEIGKNKPKPKNIIFIYKLKNRTTFLLIMQSFLLNHGINNIVEFKKLNKLKNG